LPVMRHGTDLLPGPGRRRRMMSEADAVSFLAVSREVFAPLYPYYAAGSWPIGAMTRGVASILVAGGAIWGWLFLGKALAGGCWSIGHRLWSGPPGSTLPWWAWPPG